MTRKLIKKGSCYEEWEFATQEDLSIAAKKEARIGIDEIKENGDSVHIFNFHQGSIRWKGICREEQYV
jgi:hypothetical protein